MRNKAIFLVLFILILQNIFFFFRHYFQGYAFPWDFCQTYHAVPYHWIELIRLGIDTSWIPFAGMGYPLFMNAQSGFFYPFFWLFVIFDHAYTFHAAVVMQGLHVLFGGFGAVICARLLGLGWWHALLAGVLYQCFGGFYSNAEHPDIVRSYALIPWLLSPIFADWDQLKQSRLLKTSIAILPFFVYCAWSGGYPGISIATCFIVGSVVFTRLLFGNDKKIGIIILLAYIAGTLFASIMLLPMAMQVFEVTRASQTQKQVFDFLLPSDIFALVYRVDNPYFAHNIAMRSLFVGIPVIALLLRGLKNWRLWNKWILFSCLLAVLMSTGLIHTIAVKIFPPFGFSRFVMADYRGFIGLGVILLSVSSLQYIENTNRKDNYIWAVILLLFLWIGNNLLSINGGGWFGDGMRMLAILLATILVLEPLQAKKPFLVIPALIIIALFDWTRVNWSAIYFAMEQGQEYCETASNRIANRTLLGQRLENNSECRPARINIEGSDFLHFSWRGYYSGEYMLQDSSGPMQFRRQQILMSKTSFVNFATLPWHMVTIPKINNIDDIANIDEIDFQSAISANAKCISYGTTEIHHTIDIQTPSLVVENEIYWLGWQAKLINTNNKAYEDINAIDINGFRAWYLPAGKYDMIETYKTPYKKRALLLTIFGLLIWLCLPYILWNHRIQFNFKRNVP
jgi:hypothetical protein